MKLIRKLGTRKDKLGRIRSWAIYLCDYCKIQVERRTPNNGKSCGCVAGKLTSIGLKIHGETTSRLYHILEGMKARCYNNKHESYNRYGGKGIKICEEWHNYILFKEWAVNNGYKNGFTIDRINSNRDYGPDNCQWITRLENCKKGGLGNRRFTMEEVEEIRKIYSFGKFSRARIARAYDISNDCIRYIIKHKTYREYYDNKKQSMA